MGVHRVRRDRRWDLAALAVGDVMPLTTKLLFIAVALGLLIFVVLAFVHGATSSPAPSRLASVSPRRYRHLWVVDRDEETLDKSTER